MALPDFYHPRTPPFAHQRTALELGWESPGYAYLMEMGLAKTRTFIDNACLLYAAGRIDAVLVVAAKSVYTNWTRVSDVNPGELQKWLWDSVREKARVCVWEGGTREQRRALRERALSVSPGDGLRVLAVNSEAISRADEAMRLATDYCRAHRVIIVYDESTGIGSKDSSITKAMLRMRDLAPYRRILTGSPGKPVKLWSQFEFLRPACLGHRSFYTFRERYCELRELTVSGRSVKTVVGFRNLEELASRVAQHGYRARKKECLDLPEKLYEPREIELTAEQQKLYDELRVGAMAEINASVARGDPGQVTTQLTLTQVLRMHQVACGHVKLDDGRVVLLNENLSGEVMRVLEEDDEQAVIFVRYVPEIHRLRKLLQAEYGEGSVAEWYGDVPLREREHGEAEFQAGRRKFMLSSYAGARARTWTAAHLTVYHSHDESLELRQQSEDRTHRIGQVFPCTYVDLIPRCKAARKIIESLRAGLDVVGAIMRDGPREWL